MSNTVVIGLGAGDEGKGVVTEYLCSKDPDNTIVVRFSGGQQAGHKVCKGDKEHIFSQFGSGTLSGCPTYWSKYCTFDPFAAWNEYKQLKEIDITNPMIAFHPSCIVTTPYDVFVNREMEKEHGTCGTGFYRTKKRNQDGVVLTLFELLDLSPSQRRQRLKIIRDYYQVEKAEKEENAFLDSLTAIGNIIGWCFRDTLPSWYQHTVFEGSQGLMLDEHIGHMPHCTPSDITPRNAMKMADIDEIYLVSRVYQTRHGNGPMTNENYSVDLVNTEKETNKLDKYQGKFRTSMLDLDQLVHAKTEGIDKIIPSSTKVNLVMTCADQLKIYKISTEKDIFFTDEINTFVGFISKKLKINGDLYVNTSPYSTTVRRVNE